MKDEMGGTYDVDVDWDLKDDDVARRQRAHNP